MKTVFVIIAVFAVLVASIIYLNRSKIPQPATQISTPTPVLEEKVNIKATFTIITGNITRSFRAEKYHNQSPNVYIQNPDPSVVYVTKKGIRWSDFFNTLPMKLTKECLTTGDGETFCDGKDGSLKFYLNDIETPNLLEEQIKEVDKALIKFN
ncbi:hypothetical protein HYT18_02510 [Candidatus Microgenomates bacterium]|nr:hypothetical protein [Candidatus Microgenomates bacterium]